MKTYLFAAYVFVAAALALSAAPPVAVAQPMMMDPSRMSGIPRPDPAVPAATVTVRLIRGELANRLPGLPVTLKSLSAPATPARTAQTDAEGRATFGELAPGNYQATAENDGVSLESQPIEVAAAPAPGIRVMLVFPKTVAEQQQELGLPDGKGRVDLSLPAGTIAIRAVDEAGKPMAGLKVSALRQEMATEKVESLPGGVTGADGTVSIAGQLTGNAYRYLVAVNRDNIEQPSQPFSLASDHGTRVTVTARAATKDTSALRIGPESHLIFEPQDESLQVTENWVIHNPLPQAIDTGAAGFRIPLAEGALSAQAVPGGPPNLTIDSSQETPAAVWKGPLPPGNTMVSVAFILRHHGSAAFRQQTTQKLDGLRVIIVKVGELAVQGITESEERKWNGRDLIVASAILPSAGGYIELSFTGLPSESNLLRILGAVLAAFVGLAFAYLIIYRPGEDPSTQEKLQSEVQKLLARRDVLLDELIGLESGAAPPKPTKGKPERTRAVLLAELEDVYRRLDESPEAAGEPHA